MDDKRGGNKVILMPTLLGYDLNDAAVNGKVNNEACS
jgi:hypothetical protein